MPARTIRYVPPGAQCPAPWRVVKQGYGPYALSELAEVRDAHGYTLFVCRAELAQRIVEAVNAMEPGGRDPFGEEGR